MKLWRVEARNQQGQIEYSGLFAAAHCQEAINEGKEELFDRDETWETGETLAWTAERYKVLA